MLDIRIEPILAKEHAELMQLPSIHVCRQCCATTGPDSMCGSPEIAYKVFVDGWITKDPFHICRGCYNDWTTFGHLSLRHHPLEVIRGNHISVYPEIETLTLLDNAVDDRIRQKELTPKALEIKELEVRV